MTVDKVAQWIIAYRRGKAFEGYSFEKICQQLTECAANGAMICVHDVNSNLSGVICGEWRLPNTYFVFDILTIKPGVVKQMMKYFRNRYPNHIIQGRHRTGRARFFTDINKLTNRLH